jgi:hypothetical protein
MLDAEADQLCGAGRCERSEARRDTRAGSYERTLQTSAGDVNLEIPKLRRQTFETAIIERYRRRECSVEEALIEMYRGHFSQAGGTSPAAALCADHRAAEGRNLCSGRIARHVDQRVWRQASLRHEAMKCCRSRMLPSVIGGPAGCLGLFDDVVGARKAVSDLALRWEDAAGRGVLPSPTASGWLPTLS